MNPSNNIRDIKQRILKFAWEKQQVTYKNKPTRITDFPSETLKTENDDLKLWKAAGANLDDYILQSSPS